MNDLDCVEFDGMRDKYGYGRVSSYKGRRTMLAHRVAYVESRGLDLSEINGLVVRHGCDNPACVNPGHLQIGTHADNMRDMSERKRAAAGEANWKAKLKAEEVAEIRRRFRSRSKTDGATALANEFGVSSSHIYNIVFNRLWKQS